MAGGPWRGARGAKAVAHRLPFVVVVPLPHRPWICRCSLSSNGGACKVSKFCDDEAARSRGSSGRRSTSNAGESREEDSGSGEEEPHPVGRARVAAAVAP